jgi:CRISPR-associated protein Cas2
MLFFDLPVLTSGQRRSYRQFRKALINEGFLMIQESVYVRVVTNRKSAEFLENRLMDIAPEEGIIQTLIVTEKQYASIRFLVGENIDDVRNTDDRVIII